ncbi:MAG: hypothetical protein K0S01_1224 [Herbinix sp.]|jgi:hypothetical protein|nr:hypothetical protein [Herbinix sp.]
MQIKNTQNANEKFSYSDRQMTNNNKTTESTSNKKPHNIGQKQRSNTIYAGNLNLKQNAITVEKLQAQKKAMKAILEQFSNEQSIDNGIEVRRDHQKELTKDMDLAAKEISNIKKSRQDLEEAYGITEDSEEQKDLKLLEKSMFGEAELSEEETKQLEKMGPLTEYQKTALHYDAMEEIWKNRVEQADTGITNETRTITAIKLARLKTHPMIDAGKEAAEIIEEAGKEVVGIILQQTKENIDAEQDQNMEDAKKQQEATENKPDNKDTKTGVNPVVNLISQEQLLKDLKSIADQQKILEEDIKGIVVDEEV